MKSAAGVFIQPVHDSAGERVPHRVRIASAVRHAAASGAVVQGQRLPSTRQLAKDWRVSRGAVEDAFAELELEGLIERRVGDGSYLRTAASHTAPSPRPAAPEAQRILRHSRLQRMPSARFDAARRLQLLPPFHPRRTDLDHFPLDVWRRLLLQAHDAPQQPLLNGAPCGGLPQLRAAIARHLAVHRGLSCAPEQVLVTNGPGEGLQLVARLLLSPGDTVWMEQPSHASLAWLLTSLGQRVQGVPLDDEGFDVAAGLCRAPQARACYLHPLTQYPHGRRTSLARGDALLAWAARSGGWIVEGQMNDEMLTPALQTPTLFARDRGHRTLLLGTFEGVVFPSLRVGYLVLPAPLAPSFIAAAQVHGEHAAAPVQWALAEFIDRGHMTAHLQSQRQRCHEQRDVVRRVLLPRLPPGVRAGPLELGQFLCLHLPRTVHDTLIAERLRAHGIVVECLSLLAWEDEGLNGIVLGHGGLEPDVLATGLRQIAQTLAAAYQPSGQNT